MIIRDALEADLPAIVEIYNEAIRGRISTAQLDEVSVEQRRPWFHAHLAKSYPLWVAEIDGHDKWQRATLLCAIVGDSGAEARGAEIERFIESRCPDGCYFERDLLSLNDVRG